MCVRVSRLRGRDTRRQDKTRGEECTYSTRAVMYTQHNSLET